MLAQDIFVQLLILLGKDDVVLQKAQHLRDRTEALHLLLQLPYLLVLPVEDIPPDRVPAHPVGEADGIGGREELLTDEKLRRLSMVAADLIYTQGHRLIFIGVLALDHQHRDPIDQEDHILPGPVVAIVIGPLLRHLIGVAPLFFEKREILLVVDQDEITLPLLLMIVELSPIAQVVEEFPVAVDVGVEMAQLPEEGPLRLGIAGVELPHLGIEQIVEEERSILGPLGGRHLGIKSPSPLRLLSGHNGPADLLRIGEDPGLDGFVFSGCGHDF